MKKFTSPIKNTITLTALSILLTGAVQAQAKLSLVKTSSSSVSVNLQNTTPIAGMQFTIKGSANLVLESLQKSGRTQNGNWQIYQHQLNDSTINVVILNANLVNFTAGEGAIAQFSLRETNLPSNSSSRLSFSRVVIADEYAQSVTYTLANLEWSTSIAQVENQAFLLEQNYPNPFNPSTTIRYKLEQPGQVRLSIFDITGREVMRALDQYQLGGTYSVTWNGKDEAGRQVASGMYFAQLNLNGAVGTMRMTLAK